MKIILKVQW